jgi:hypothetical protein
VTNWRRSWVKVRESRRETCISEIPTWAAISVWVSPPKNRSTRIAPFAVGQRREQRCETFAVLDQVERRLGLPDRGGEATPVRRASAVVLPSRSVQRCHVGYVVGRQRFDDGLDVQVEVPGDLARPRGAVLALGEFGGGGVNARLQLA